MSELPGGGPRPAAVRSSTLVATLRTLLVLLLVVTHLLVAGGAFVRCAEGDGSLVTELALAVCCEAPGAAPSAPEAPASVTDDVDDCGPCADERFGPSVDRPHGAAASVPPLPDVSVASVDLVVPGSSRVEEAAVLPADTSPRHLRPALLRS